MTLDERVLAQRRALLEEKLKIVERLAGHLGFSLGRFKYPLDGLDTLDPISLESVSAPPCRGELRACGQTWGNPASS